MALELKTQLKLRPELILTPQLRLALKLLQMNRLELEEYLRTEVEKNPVLELREEDLSLEALAPTGELHQDEEHPWEALFAEEFSPYPSFSFEEPEEISWESRLKQEEGLYEHLRWQLTLAALSEEDLRLAEYLLRNLDERGYLTLSPAEAARDLGVSSERVEEVRRKIQFFDPVGVASLSVEECLLVQLDYLGFSDSLAARLVREHFRDLAKGVDFLAQKLQVPPEEVAEALEIIRGLEPFPGRAFSSGQTLYLTPDVIFYKEGGRWRVRLYEEGLPRLRISPYYRRLLADPTVPRKVKFFLRDKLRAAEWLMKSLDQRGKTLLRVAEVLADLQRDFLEKGPAYLRPLNLREVAERVGVHESTVSRVTHRKYAETPNGLVELKSFFPSGLKKIGGGAVSSEAVKEYLRELILKENPQKPYTDQELARMLSQKYGVKIARRTVAKYREILGIPSARVRKKV
ncbi:RNA polymerase factor sigma-54 [Thermosulfurimonas marina]|uniref:RNA polymerase factor sigma-54 n=1 Tax=Thermosulfurimonas marina TaxID=2047767 RepID=A0A6H1WUR1_9BACT|nr:RNA polymerase factor sigma-54 [Thermosulfurimonas marina]QJA06937.1 RNA polymerase factor sigma-54 [Thermosulfurimonas marina]